MLGRLLILLGMVVGYFLAFNYFKTSVDSEEEIMKLEDGDFRKRAAKARAATREKAEELDQQIGSMFEEEVQGLEGKDSEASDLEPLETGERTSEKVQVKLATEEDSLESEESETLVEPNTETVVDDDL